MRIDTSMLLLGTYPKDTPFYHKTTCSAMFIAALSIIARTWKQPRCPSAKEWKKMWYIYTMKYYSSVENNDITIFAGKWMELEKIILIEVT